MTSRRSRASATPVAGDHTQMTAAAGNPGAALCETHDSRRALLGAVTGLPTSFVFDPDGQVRGVVAGGIPARGVSPRIAVSCLIKF